MKKYHYHPDSFIIITNENKTYIELSKLANFDMQNKVVNPSSGITEFQYIQGYGTKSFNKGDMVCFCDADRPELNSLIDSIDVFLEKKKLRESLDNSVWKIPEDMNS